MICDEKSKEMAPFGAIFTGWVYWKDRVTSWDLNQSTALMP